MLKRFFAPPMFEGLRTVEMDEMQLMMEGLRRLDEEKKEPMK